MTSIKRNLIFTLLLFLCAGELLATHIVGGGITYECLGTIGNSRNYRFTLKVYRDCINGQAQFDNPAHIAIYAGTFNSNFLYDNFDVPLGNIVPITVNEPDCIDNLPLICLEEATYTWDATLPVSNQSYFVEYQRCCRTNAIANLIGPGDTGATYYVELTPAAQQLCNDGPTFTRFPPVVICNNYPLEVDYSANDQNGDKLVYSFCAPYSGGGPVGAGGNCFTPLPSPPCPPPYDEVVFATPLYSATQPMGGNPIINIDPQTGLITGTPNALGQFVVGVCVEEYRNGVLLSVTRRDFQFNVAPCAPQVTALVDYDELAGPQHYIIKKCDGTTNLTIDNQSFNLGNIQTFEWNFNLNNGNFVNNTTNFDLPITFPSLGVYNGTLILNKGLDCGDTAFIQVQLYAPATLDLGDDIMICNDTTIVFDAGPNFESYQWQNGSTGQTFTATTSGIYHVKAIDHCGNELRDSVRVIIAPIPNLQLPDVVLCPGESTVVDVPGFSTYTWSPGTGLSCTNCQTVTVAPASSTQYSVLAVNAEGCAASDEFNVTVLPTPMATYTIQFYPNESVTLGGQTYTQSTTVVLNVPSTTGGCDSLNTYILELIPTDISIQCPPNQVVPLPANASSVLVEYDQPTATSDCPGAAPTITLTQGLASNTNFPGGVNTVCYEATNTCGNHDTCCFTVTVTELHIQCPANLTVALPNNTASIPVNYSIPTATTDCSSPATVQLQHGLASGANFPAGVNTVCYGASNACGNQDSCCFTVTVTTLTIQCPANLTVALPNNATSIPVNYNLPTATTNCPGSTPNVQLTQGLPSGGNFLSGVNTVCYEATNTCGNQASCCFTVTVTTIDIQCPANISVPIPNNANSVAVTFAAATASTNCPGSTPTVSQIQGPASGSNFPAGVTTVCYQATNTCGNQKSCCFTVTASTLDIKCPANVIVQLPVAAVTVNVNYAAPTTTTNCPPASVNLIQGQASGTGFPLGIHKVCYEGTTTCGNRDSCCFTVTVLDAPPPCDIKQIGCAKFELLDIRLDSIDQRRYRIRATNFCPTEVDYVAFQLPIGVIAVTPKEGWIYTAPNSNNQYLVRNPNASPFYSIRYRSVNTGLKNGEADVFEYRLPQQSKPAYIHSGMRLKNGEFYAAHLNTWYCPVQPWAGVRGEAGDDFGDRYDEESVTQPVDESSLDLRPNPTTGLVYVDMLQWEGQAVRLQVINPQGQIVLDRQYGAVEEWIELEMSPNLSNGLYFLMVQPEGGAKAAARFLLER